MLLSALSRFLPVDMGFFDRCVAMYFTRQPSELSLRVCLVLTVKPSSPLFNHCDPLATVMVRL